MWISRILILIAVSVAATTDVQDEEAAESQRQARYAKNDRPLLLIRPVQTPPKAHSSAGGDDKRPSPPTKVTYKIIPPPSTPHVHNIPPLSFKKEPTEPILSKAVPLSQLHTTFKADFDAMQKKKKYPAYNPKPTADFLALPLKRAEPEPIILSPRNVHTEAPSHVHLSDIIVGKPSSDGVNIPPHVEATLIENNQGIYHDLTEEIKFGDKKKDSSSWEWNQENLQEKLEGKPLSEPYEFDFGGQDILIDSKPISLSPELLPKDHFKFNQDVEHDPDFYLASEDVINIVSPPSRSKNNLKHDKVSFAPADAINIVQAPTKKSRKDQRRKQNLKIESEIQTKNQVHFKEQPVFISSTPLPREFHQEDIDFIKYHHHLPIPEALRGNIGNTYEVIEDTREDHKNPFLSNYHKHVNNIGEIEKYMEDAKKMYLSSNRNAKEALKYTIAIFPTTPKPLLKDFHRDVQKEEEIEIITEGFPPKDFELAVGKNYHTYHHSEKKPRWTHCRLLQNCDVHLHAEIEVLKQALAKKQTQLIAMETACMRESDRQVELEDSIIAWQDKYDRLYESHKRVQKVNQNLEDKLLKLVDRNASERAQLTSDVATLSVRLAQANYNIASLQREIERYKMDMSLAIQLLQCKPDSFVSQKISSLPAEIQSKVASYMRLDTNSHSDSEGSTSGAIDGTSRSYRVLPASDSPPPLCPFPPTAMVYSMRGIADAAQSPEGQDQVITPSTMAKFLEDELKSSEIKHCESCQCTTKDLTVLPDTQKTYTVGTQTLLHGEANNSLCLRCNSNLNSPSRTNSPYIMKLVKSSDSVISETKSSVSNSTQNEKLFTPVKKEELMVNPILGHHRICDRTSLKSPMEPLTDPADSENPKINGPRLCSVRIQNGSTNILLDGAEASVVPVVYTRRSRFLDEELDDTKEVITTQEGTCDTAKISMVMANGNKTDSEKCLEVAQGEDGKDIKKSMKSTGTQSSSVSSDTEMQETVLLRRQQLTRVAEWVQTTQLDRRTPSDASPGVNNNVEAQPEAMHVKIHCDEKKIVEEEQGTGHEAECTNGNERVPKTVDFAQMEYNVKQFLLKQNEWSIHNKQAPILNKPHRTETNL
uniref:Uncharacterized protein n=1 Tax=Lutzomyia longipalpis TaxID=7200 RepID=A0A1B0CK95_LUTLO